VQHCCTTIVSILCNNKDVSISLFTEGLRDENVDLINNLVSQYGGTLRIYTIDSSTVKNFPMPVLGGSHISIATYYRLFASLILPQEIKKAIYLDCDIVIRGSLEPMWNIDLSDYALGAVYQNLERPSYMDMDRLSIPHETGYFNAGVLLINLEYWRNHNVTNRLFQFIQEKGSVIKQHDQDVLNAVLHNETIPISYTWNCISNFLSKRELQFVKRVDYSEKIDNPVVVHFVCIPKPWDYGSTNPYTSEYFKYLDLTPFKGWRPKLIWKKYIRDVVKPRMWYALISLDVLHMRRLFRSYLNHKKNLI
jgi:lipopolysaccharide biosynthesis glycosyltransferase